MRRPANQELDFSVSIVIALKQQNRILIPRLLEVVDFGHLVYNCQEK